MDEQTYEVEKIIDHRGEEKTREYYIRWKDYTSDYDEWLPKESCNCPDLIDAYWKEKGVTKRKRGRPRKTPISEAGPSSRPEPEPARVSEETENFSFVAANPLRHTKIDPTNYAQGLISPEKIRKSSKKRKKRNTSLRGIEIKNEQEQEPQTEIIEPVASEEAVGTASDNRNGQPSSHGDLDMILENEEVVEILEDNDAETLSKTAQAIPPLENVSTDNGIVDTKLLYAHIDHEPNMVEKRICQLGGIGHRPLIPFPKTKDKKRSVEEFDEWLTVTSTVITVEE